MTTASQIATHLLRSRIGKICVAITGSSADEMTAKAAEVLKETTFIEFRLDYLPKPAASLAHFKEFLAANTAATVVATCRCKDNGGRFDGSATAELDILLKAAEAGFQIVDLEIESIEKLPKNTMDRLREAGAAVIISWHDFHATKDLDAIYHRIEPFAADYIKLVPTARNLSDNLTLMHFMERMEDQSNANIVGICMGEPGIISRILGLRAGSAFTFAAANAGEETAAGQITARTLIETYRIDQVDAATKVYGVAGNPIRSSLSPLMMNTAFRRETVNAVYLALQTSKADDLFKLVKEIPLQGLSVTMPLKQDVIPLLERTDALSAKIGAVNTISRMADGKYYGFNTDVAGIVGPLERRLSLKGAKVLVLGAGGAARAAVFGCRDKGADVWILNRTPESAQKLARQAGAKTIRREAVAKTGFDVIINATPVGMAGAGTAKHPLEPILGPEDLTARIVFDLVYNPIETPLLRMARQKGIAVISGVEMFVQQGARQFEIWTGKPAPEEEMLRVVLHALRQNSEGPAAELPTSAKVATVAPPVSHADPEPAAKAEPKVTTVVKHAPEPKPAAKAATKAPAAKPAAKKPAPPGPQGPGSGDQEATHGSAPGREGTRPQTRSRRPLCQASRKISGAQVPIILRSAHRWGALVVLCLLAASAGLGQTVKPPAPAATSNSYEDDPAADPARPTVTNPAHIPPPGYLQFEQGFLQANTTPGGPDKQFSLNQTTKLSLDHHLMVFLLSQPFARSSTVGMVSNDPGDLDLGAQVVLFDEGEGRSTRPSVALSYINRVRGGSAANLDTGSFDRSALLLASGTLYGLHYDTNFIVNQQTADTPNAPSATAARRPQFGQTISVTHNFTEKFSLSGELWHFSQPLAHSRAIGNLWTIGYTPRKTLVLDAGFSRGLTSTSTHWETFAGFTYLLPHRLFSKRFHVL